MTVAQRAVKNAVALVLVGGALVGLAGSAAQAQTHAKRSRPRVSSSAPRRSKADSSRTHKAPTVAFTVLLGDTHAKLAEDLTGNRDTEVALRKMEPHLTPGETIRVPEPMLLPGLSDGNRETLVFGKPYPTLWSVARRTRARNPAELGRMARNLQRINSILNPDRLTPGTKILVPRSLLSAEAPAEDEASTAQVPETEARILEEPARSNPGAFVRSPYRVTDVEGLDRRTPRFPDRLRLILSDRQLLDTQSKRGEISLVVIHTTEHRGSTFENTATYIKRKRLANYLIGRDGSVFEIVPEGYRAYGCGDSVWDGRFSVDYEAINVEVFANTEKGEAIADAQYEALGRLIADIRSRRPKVDETRVVTHKMVALNYKTGMRSRKGDPYDFDWAKAGLPDNSKIVDLDLLEGRAKLCTDCRYTDRITTGQTEAARMRKKL